MAWRSGGGRKTVAIIAVALLWSRPLNAAPVGSAEKACDVAKARTAALWHFPVSAIAFCEPIDEAHNPKGYFVVGLHGKRDDCGGDVCGSTLMGWFAVEKKTGRVHEWDTAEMKVGPLIKARR